MGFDAKRFMQERFEPRKESIPVPFLKPFFEKDETPVWKIRGLTGPEYGRVNEAPGRNAAIAQIAEELFSGISKKQAAAIRSLVGGTENETPEDVAKRLEMLVIGSVDPECDLELAIKFCKVAPIQFWNVTNRISILTGQGHVPGKQKPSGATPG